MHEPTRTPIDIILRHQIRVEQLGLGLARDIADDLGRAIESLDDKLAGLADDASVTYERSFAIRSHLVPLRDTLYTEISRHTDQAIETITETSFAGAQSALQAASEFSGTPQVKLNIVSPNLTHLASVRDLPHDGFTWQRWGSKLADDTVGRLESELRQSIAIGESSHDLRRRFHQIGDMSKVAAGRLANTMASSAANRARYAIFEENSDIVSAYRYVSTLDARTTAICMGLDGHVFKRGEEVPHPPRHPNCRSVLVPVIEGMEEQIGNRPSVGVTDRELKGLSKEERAKRISEKVGQVPAKTSYGDWLKKQPASFQKETLGPIRFRAFRRGLPLSSMATADRRLSIDELRNLYPEKTRGL